MILDILSKKLNSDILDISYNNSKPYPHMVVDNFLKEDFANSLHNDVRSILKDINVSNNFTQKNKVATNDWSKFNRSTFDFISFLNSSIFTKYLEETTKIDCLIPDPSLEGGGVHSVSKHGFLKMHSDFNWHDKLKLYRRINVILYLNKDWNESMKGELILSPKNFKNFVSIKPIFNRLVIFNTNDNTYHGHPEKIEFPDSYPRTSIATYYYTRSRPFNEVARFRSSKTKYIPFLKNDIDTSDITFKQKLGYFLRRYTPFG